MLVRRIISRILAISCACSIQIASAEIADKHWQGIKNGFFPNATIVESTAIKISAPDRAESGAQVPFSFSIDSPMTDQRYIKSVTVIAGANPVPLVAVWRFSPNSGDAEVSTRIRLEVDSYVHVVAETNDGKLLMNKVLIRASGGCGGTIGGDVALARQTAGKMKLSVGSEGEDDIKEARLLIKHPMITGLQRDLASQGFPPAFFIDKIVARFNDQVVLDADTYIGISEDPYIRFPFKADRSGTLTVVIRDNEGKEFTTATDVKVN
jgi:sulfur-oxidizing protein SoxY